MQIGASPVEQADDGGVDVPCLVGSGRAQADLWLDRVQAEPGPAPAEPAHQVIPGRGRCPDLAEPLRQDGERAGRDVPVLERGHHILDGLDLAWSKTTGRRVRT